MTSDSSDAVICSQCGTPGKGNYCANCGASLTPSKESVSEEVRSKFTSPLTAALSFFKAVWLMWVSPAVFLRSYFTGVPPLSELPFPLSSAWRRVHEGPQRVMGPFQSLALAIALVAVLGSLERTVWSDFGQRTFGLSMAEVRERREQFRSAYEQTYGRKPHIVDTAHLTGFEIVDNPIAEIVTLLNYVYFPLVAVILLARGNVKRYQVMHAYIYAMSAALCGFAATDALGLIVFAAGVQSGSIYTVAMSGWGTAVGLLIIIYFVVILPIFILPKVLRVAKARVVLATCVAALAWLAGRIVIFSVLPWQFGLFLT